MMHFWLLLSQRSRSQAGLSVVGNRADAKIAALARGGPSGWNASTMCLRRIHRSMVADGWGRRIEQPPFG